ncbi:hypothetical protein [Nocardia macrotermitis]|uniref:YbaB/EbfC DNA-binding family protein n=1 Tax=Nocardia macrotermitis TaxID=2585198 RepID=A0A7K0D7E6_9NOCA|nr:hypothetical protein [Nocardia macrotermitis]MQY21628.1 hypothetical protein [Nocardia macrotermitis]
MNDELLSNIARYHAYTQDWLQRFNSVATPNRVSGYDSSGLVTVTVGPQIRFLELYVADDWERGLSAPSVSAAVTEAARAAERAAASETASAMVEESVLDHLQEMRPEDYPATPINMNAALPLDYRTNPSLDQILDEVLTLVETGTESGSHGNIVANCQELGDAVTVILSPDGVLIDCHIAAGWASGRTGGTLSWAVNEAVAEASGRLSRFTAAGRSRSAADRIAADAIVSISKLGQ